MLVKGMCIGFGVGFNHQLYQSTPKVPTMLASNSGMSFWLRACRSGPVARFTGPCQPRAQSQVLPSGQLESCSSSDSHSDRAR